MSLDKPRMNNIKQGVPSTIHKVRELRFSWMSGSVEWYLPKFCDNLSVQTSVSTNLRHITSQKSEDPTCNAAEAWNHSQSLVLYTDL